MAMDFFQHQEEAHRNTRRLVVIFVLGVLTIVVSIHLAVSLALQQASYRVGMASAEAGWVDAYLLNPEIFAWVALAVVGVVSSGSLYKMKALGAGGESVATGMGGRRLDPSQADPDERRLLNVVEEMAIASGVPVPPVFVMDGEEGINAFAAGYEPTHAVIGVTRGAVRHLDREELQGVIAHEFSHILNGDMRLNIRLIGILHGVLLIGIVGRVLLHSGSRRRRDRGSQVAILGLALLVIGYLGTLCGNLIKAAVSREREFLADASAVQFTRNPEGLGGALKKLAGLAQGSRLEHPRASELSHMYFGQGVANRLGSLFSTHPPLDARIRRIDPSFESDAPETDEGRRLAAALGEEGVSGLAAGPGAAPPGTGSEPRPPVAPGPEGEAAPEAASPPEPGSVSLDEALRQIGRPTPAHVAYVRKLLAGVPAELREAARDREGARALILALLLDRDPEVRGTQGEMLRERWGEPARARVFELLAPARELDPNARLPLLEMSVATLQGLDEEEYRKIRRTMEELAEADRGLGLFEWVAGSLVLRHLDPSFTRQARRGRFTRLQGVSDSVACLLSALAHAGHDDSEEARFALAEGLDALDEIRGFELLDRARCGPRALDAALDTLSHLIPQRKRELLEACARTIAADRRVTTREGELFRVIADWLDCPVPPLLPGQAVA